MLTASHGRSCSPGIRPIGCSTAARAFFIEAPHDRRPPSSANVAHASSDAGTLRLCRLRFSRNPDYTESGGPPPEGDCGEGNAEGNSVDGSSSKETSCRRSCREGNRPQPLEVASLLKLAATNVLFPCHSVFLVLSQFSPFALLGTRKGTPVFRTGGLSPQPPELF